MEQTIKNSMPHSNNDIAKLHCLRHNKAFYCKWSSTDDLIVFASTYGLKKYQELQYKPCALYW